MNASVKAVQYRIARPTDRLREVVQFYNEAIGLPVIGSFNDHDGYDGVMIGMPGSGCHLEFTHHANGSPCPAPSRDNLLVLYFDKPADHQEAVARMSSHGYTPVAPENPYWEDKSLTFEDPDGWRVVLFNGIFSQPL